MKPLMAILGLALFAGTASSAGAAGEIEARLARTDQPLSFVRDILPILSKAGCSGAACHSKPEGQNGFHLSVFAHDPESDYQEIVMEGRGRRVFPAAPEQSLLLRKPSLGVAHEGGQRFTPGSPEYRALERWIREGMPYRREGEADLVELEVVPAEGRYQAGAEVQLGVRARFRDGEEEVVTHLAHFDSADGDLAEVDRTGRILVKEGPGETAIVVRYMGQVAMARVTVPSARLLPADVYAALPVNNFIDRLAYDHFQKLGLLPSAPSSDAEFFRRAALDATGTLPTVAQAEAFLADGSPERRSHWVDQVLEDPAYADHWAIKWGDLLRPNPARVGVKSVWVMDQWLRESFRRNKPYDQMARELILAVGSTHRDGPTVVYRDRRDPEDLTTLFSQILLGVRLDCARCHHHPNERWGQEDFYEFAAFFAEVKRKGTGISPPISGGEEFVFHTPGGAVKHPKSGAVMQPRPLRGERLTTREGHDPRESLAEWVGAPDNPFLARAVVNRVWAEFFGRGIVEPVDDFRESNPAAIPELLDALARDFVAHGYDLKHLMRTIMQSHLYQLSSLPNETNVRDTKYFSRSYRRRLPAEVLLDAVSRVTETTDSFEGVFPGGRAAQAWNNQLDSLFMDAFGRPDSSADCPCERNRRVSVVQALHLMHSEDLQGKLAQDGGRAARLAGSDQTEEALVRELYLAALSREPTEREMAVARRVFTAEGATRRTAVEDLLWALLNSAEFVFNH